MVVLTVKKNLLKVIIVSACVILLGVSSLNIMVKSHHKIMVYNINEFELAFVSSFLVSHNAELEVEIFDIEKGKVIKVIQPNEIILAETQKCLHGIAGMYPEVKAFPDKGYIIKVPFEPKTKVKNHFLNDYGINSIDKAFIILPEEKSPYILVLDARKRPYFYCFTGDIYKLLKSLNMGT